MDTTTALAVLDDALNRCRKKDVRTPNVFAALDFLQARATQKWPFDQFRRELEGTDPEGKWQILNASLNGIKLHIKDNK